MTRREELLENLEDALFALMMDDLVQEENQRLLAENQRLKEDPEANVSSSLEDRCRRLIRQGLADAAAGEKAAPIKTGYQKVLRKIASIAATIAVFLALIIAVQAAGIDVFGAMATWTEDIFRFVPNFSNSDTKNQDLANALIEAGLTDALMPTWFPENFIPDEPDVFVGNTVSDVSMYLDSESGDKNISYWVTRYVDIEMISQTFIQKDDGPVETREINGVQYYFMTNLDRQVAAWQEGHYVGSIAGDISHDELIKIIESMEVP